MKDWEGNEFVHNDKLVVIAIGQYNSTAKMAFKDPETGDTFVPKQHIPEYGSYLYKIHLEGDIIMDPASRQLYAAFPNPDDPSIGVCVPIEEVEDWKTSQLVYCKGGKNDDEERIFREVVFKFSDN